MSFILTDGWKISAIIKFAIKKNTWMYDVRCPPCILQLRLLSYLKLKSRLQICFFLYFIYVSFMKMSISCLLKSIVSVKETLISFNNKQRRHWKWTLCYGKCWPNFLSQATNFQQSELLIYIFSFLYIKSSFSYLICSYMRRLAIQNLLKCTGTLQIFIDPHWYFILDTRLILRSIQLFIYKQTCANVNAYAI
jgi:hypothetical protein